MIKRLMIALLVIVSPVSVKSAEISNIAIIPQPQKLEIREGRFNLGPKMNIAVSDDFYCVGEYLSQQLASAAGFKLEVKKISSLKNDKADGIVLRSCPEKTYLGEEGYELKITKKQVLIDAHSAAGAFYACQTLRQLLSVTADRKTCSIPCVEVQDKPRFQWRGLMIDCSRTFWPKEYIKRYIDLLAYHKMNVLHLHLTDNQGWRIEIKKHPELTTIGSKFSPKYEGERNGYYSQEDIKEIVKYAASRYVMVVPEIETPGHCLAALAAYPELFCKERTFEIYPERKRPSTEPVRYAFCIGNEKTFTLLEDVLSEVVELFPSKYVHIGVDERPKGQWEKCPKCQAKIKAEGLKDANELQSYFVKRIEKFVNSKNKQVLGWDEILEGGVAPNAAVMSWRGFNGGIEAAKSGHDVVMCPRDFCYFDYQQFESPEGYVGRRRIVLLTEAYSFEPIPHGLTSEQSKHILGAQANMWTHLARNEDTFDQQVFPRLAALSEVVWSPKEARNWNNFRDRLRVYCKRLDGMGVKYYRDPVWADVNDNSQSTNARPGNGNIKTAED